MNNNTSGGAQNRLGAVSPIEHLLFRDTVEETVNRIWKEVYLFHEGANRGFGMIQYKNRLQYIEDKAKVYRFEMSVSINKSDIEYLVKHCPTISDIDSYFMILYDNTYFPDRDYTKTKWSEFDDERKLTFGPIICLG